jgi:Zn finger protein HypA/HybF involved in hydrogenase expression
MYCYCYYCERYLTVFGQATRCPDCQSEVASLSQCGMLHYETAQRLRATAKVRKQMEVSHV